MKMLFSGTRVFLLKAPPFSSERSHWPPGRLEDPLSAHLLAFPRGQGQGQGQGPMGEMSPPLGVTFLPRLPRQQNKSKSYISTKAGEGRAALCNFPPQKELGSQLGRGCSLKIKNYSVAFLCGGKQKPAHSHRSLFSPRSTLSTPGRPTGRPGRVQAARPPCPRPTHTVTLRIRCPSGLHLGAISQGRAASWLCPVALR